MTGRCCRYCRSSPDGLFYSFSLPPLGSEQTTSFSTPLFAVSSHGKTQVIRLDDQARLFPCRSSFPSFLPLASPTFSSVGIWATSRKIKQIAGPLLFLSFPRLQHEGRRSPSGFFFSPGIAWPIVDKRNTKDTIPPSFFLPLSSSCPCPRLDVRWSSPPLYLFYATARSQAYGKESGGLSSSASATVFLILFFLRSLHRVADEDAFRLLFFFPTAALGAIRFFCRIACQVGNKRLRGWDVLPSSWGRRRSPFFLDGVDAAV